MKQIKKVTSVSVKIHKFERLKIILCMIFNGEFDLTINDKLRKQLKELQKYL